MKRIVLLILALSLPLCLFGCGNTKNIYGTYEFETVIFLSALSSASPDFKSEQMQGTNYIIKENSFETIPPKGDDYSSKYDNITYEKTKLSKRQLKLIEDNLLGFNDQISITHYKKAYQYALYKDNNSKANKPTPYIFEMDDEIWIVNYVDNTADHSNTIISIYKLNRVK